MQVSLFSDDRLVRRAVAGDERAFAAIYRRYHQDLYRFCLAIVANAEDAQDALQNTMVKALRALPGERRRIELKPWLYRIAHNESVEVLRRRRPVEELDPELSAGAGDLAEDAEARERLRGLLADLDQLPERQRGALVMRELSGLGYAEIAAALGTSPAVARQTLYEARLSLRQMDAGREMECDAVTRALSDADGRVARRRDIRAHLRACPDCRLFRDELESRSGDLAALSPLPAVAAAGLLQGLLGGGGASGAAGAGLGGAAAGGAAKSLGASVAVKSAATVAVVATVGVGVADRGGVVDVTPWNGGAGKAPEERPAGADVSAPSGASVAPDAVQGEGGAVAARSGDAAVRSGAVVEAGAHPDGEGVSGGAGSGTAGTAAPAAAGTEFSSGYPRGRGHEKQHPDKPEHGRQTAAGHKAGGKGKGRGEGSEKPAKPPKPGKPNKPAKPEKPAKPTQPAAAGGAKPSPKKAFPEPVPAAPQAESAPSQGGAPEAPPHAGPEK